MVEGAELNNRTLYLMNSFLVKLNFMKTLQSYQFIELSQNELNNACGGGLVKNLYSDLSVLPDIAAGIADYLFAGDILLTEEQSDQLIKSLV